MKKRIFLAVLLIILVCVLLYKVLPLNIEVNVDSPIMIGSVLSGASVGTIV